MTLKKRKASIVLAFILILTLNAPALAVTLDINGRNYQADVGPSLQADITVTPLEVLADTLGCEFVIENDTISLRENQDTLTMTLGNQTAQFNGKEKIMPLPPQLIDDQIYLPLRFVYECFGAQVSWEDATNTIKVVYDETRNDMTVEDVLLKSSEKVKQAASYKMVANVQQDMEMALPKEGTDAESMHAVSDSEVTAWVQMEPMIMYMRQTALMNVPNAPNPEAQSIETEMLFNEDGIYMTMPGTGWVKMNLPIANLEELMKQSLQQDPATSMQQMKDMGVSLAFANDQEKDGQKYWVIDSKIGSEALKSDYYKQILNLLPENEASADVLKMMDAMEMDMSYSTWINPETLYNDYIFLSAKIKLSIDIPPSEGNTGGTMTMVTDMTADYTITDYGKSFTVPDVSDAKTLEQALPAPEQQ